MIPKDCTRRFRVKRPLAEGGFGAVYEAEQVDLGRRVALKILKSAAFDHDNAVERFLREAKGTAQLDHPHIVRIIDHGVDDGIPWIAYEYLGGGSLAGAMKNGAMEWRRAIWHVRQVCLALEYAHAAQILHRDIKPQNVLLAESGQAKVADFGLAKWNLEATILTETGAVLGTPYYMAPEILNGETQAASDQYAVGVMFFEMITGRRLFLAETPVQVLLKHANAPRPAPSTVIEGIPPELDRVVLQALQRLPGDRFPDVGALRAALEELAPESTRTSPLALPDAAALPAEGSTSQPGARKSGASPAVRASKNTPAPRGSKNTPALRASKNTPALRDPGAAPAPRTRPALVAGLCVVGLLGALAIRSIRVQRDAAFAEHARDLLASATPAPPRVDLAALDAERAALRQKADSAGLIGALMFQALKPGGSPMAMRAPMERALAIHREIVRRSEAALTPLDSDGVRAGQWPLPAAETAARLAALTLLSRMDVDRGNRFLPRLSEKNAGDFLGTSVDIMLSQSFSRTLLGDLHRQHDWVAAVVLQATESPSQAGPHTAWALLDLVRAAKQFSQTPIEGFTGNQLIAHARARFATHLKSTEGVGAALGRLAPNLFAVGVQGNVAASALLVDGIAADAAVVAAALPGAADAFRSLPLRLRSLYPPRGAPGATVTPDWPFAP